MMALPYLKDSDSRTRVQRILGSKVSGGAEQDLPCDHQT